MRRGGTVGLPTLPPPHLPRRFSKSMATRAVSIPYSKNDDFSIKIDRGKGVPFRGGVATNNRIERGC